LEKVIDNKSNRILPVIVIAQFAGTSLWFAGNAVLSSLQEDLNLQGDVLGHITSSVQFGFITGTLIFALLTVADRFSPSRIFFVCSIAGALSNSAVIFLAEGFYSLMVFRFLTGFFLAGIYPVGMKVASDWHEKGLGKALGYLVGALVLGTAFPHLLRDLAQTLPWKFILVLTSCFSVAGGLMMLLLVPDGPFRRKSQRLNLRSSFRVFNDADFRAAALGYFGHMWELYTLWAFIPLILLTYNNFNPEAQLNISLLSFLIIAVGGLSCMAGGYLSQKVGSDKVAFAALLLSCLCCLLSPFVFYLDTDLFILFLLFWGMVITADSPQLSALVAQAAPKDTVGTALTIVTSLGFAITIVSIQFVSLCSQVVSQQYLYTILSLGPILGLFALSGLLKKKVLVNR
jgi:predicted MFS family arabinose efflux permease